MLLALPPIQFKTLRQLVTQYNQLAETDGIQTLFFLQKINFELNSLTMTKQLYEWLYQTGDKSWQRHLSQQGINPYASFFLKTVQFAEAVVKLLDSPLLTMQELDSTLDNGERFLLMQQRDALFKDNKSFSESREQYINICQRLSQLAKNNERFQTTIQRQAQVLEMAKGKIEAILYPDKEVQNGVAYQTEILGEQINNHNFKFTMGADDTPYVFRVEARNNFGKEHELSTFPIAQHFLEDYASFMMVFKEEGGICYRPVVLSQFARQGDLTMVAKKLKNTHPRLIPSNVEHYFVRLTDHCAKLIAAKTYHPDIKLANFLVDSNRLLMADRKTLTDNETPKASEIASSPVFAPPEYTQCLSYNHNHINYNFKAHRTRMNMPKFMAFQLGMALKQFLILTQLDDIPEDFSDPDRSAKSYFTTPSRQIINLSLLIQELTRPDPDKRMSIEQLQRLLKYKVLPVDKFYQQLEKELPAQALGIEADITEIQELINSSLSADVLLEKANSIFQKISAMDPKETRITYMAEKLASQCFNLCSKPYFENLSQSIESAIHKQEWQQAPWYRKALYWITFGWYALDSIPSLDFATINIQQDLHGEAFNRHFPQLEFLPAPELNQLGNSNAENFKEFIVAHISEIMPPDLDDDISDSNAEPTALNNKDSTHPDNMGFSSVIINDNDSINPGNTGLGTVIISDNIFNSPGNTGFNSVIIKDNSLNTTENTGFNSVIITDTDNPPLPEADDIVPDFVAPPASKDPSTAGHEGLQQCGLFAVTSQSNKKPLSHLEKVDSIRSTLFRGNGSNRLKPARARVSLAEMQWTAPNTSL